MTFFCDGQDAEQERHPKIYLNFGDKKQIDCPYCGNKFEFVDKNKVQSDNTENNN